MEVDRDIVIEMMRRLNFDLSKVNTGRNNIMVSCIEHDDNHPSCSINLEKGLYHCFSCDRSGKLTNLYFEHFGRSIFRDLGIKREGGDNFSFGASNIPLVKIDYDKTPDSLVKFEGEAVKAWSSTSCRKYLEGRGITKEVSENMNMWFALKGKVIDLNNDDPKENYIEYKNRLMIPIREGIQTISIEGRDVLGKESYTGKAGYKKVLYPKGSSTSTLYQLEKLDKKSPLFFVEGLMDLGVLRTFNKFKNSTSVFGASISHRQVYLLNKFDTLIFIIDNDIPGWNSLLKLGQNLGTLEKNAQYKLYYIVPPKGCKDAGDIPQKLHMTIEECYNRNGFAREKLWNEEEIKNKLKELRDTLKIEKESDDKEKWSDKKENKIIREARKEKNDK